MLDERRKRLFWIEQYNPLLSGGGAVEYVNLIVGYTLDPLSRFVTVFFNPNVYGSAGGGLQANEIQLIFTQNGGDATACVISSITNTSDGALVGGEQEVKVNLSFTGEPSGEETIEIKSAGAGAYKDGDGNLCSADDTTGTVSVFGGYDEWYKEGLQVALDNDIAVPPAAQRAVHNDWFVGVREDGDLTEFDTVNILDFTSDFARIKFGATAQLLGSLVNTPVTTLFVGTKGSVSGFINLGIVPATHFSKFTTIYNAIMVLVDNNGQSDGFLTGSRGAASGSNKGHNAIRARSSSNVFGSAVNVDSIGLAVSVSSFMDSEGTFLSARESPPDANNITRASFEGTQVGTGANNQSVLSEQPIYACAKNDNGTPSVIDQVHDIRIIGYGSGSLWANRASIKSRNDAYKAAMNALLPTLTARVYAIIGQSNVDYSNGVLSDLTSEQAALYNNGPISIANGYDANVYIVNSSGELELLEAGVNGVQAGTDKFGPIYPFAVAEAAKYPGENLVIVKEAIGGSGMYTTVGHNPNWLPGGSSTSRYEVFLARYAQALSQINTVSAFMPVWWFQGEQDCIVEQDSIDYGSLFSGLNNESIMMSGIRANTGFDDFIVSQIFPAQPGFVDNVRAQKVENESNGVYGTGGALISADDLGTIGHLSITKCITNAIRVSDAFPTP